MHNTEHGPKYEITDDPTLSGLSDHEWAIVTHPTEGVQYDMSDSHRSDAVGHNVGLCGMEITDKVVEYQGSTYATGPDGYVWYVPSYDWECAYPLAGMDLYTHGLNVPIEEIHLGWRIACALSVLHGKF